MAESSTAMRPPTIPPPADAATSSFPSEAPTEILSTLSISATASKPPCPFLDKLPAELRNDIYELTFSPDDSKPVDLLSAKPPQKALLMTCRSIHQEAKGVYQNAYQKFWEETEFQIHITDLASEKQPILERLSSLSEADLEKVTNLTIIHDRSKRLDPRRRTYTLDDMVFREDDSTYPDYTFYVHWRYDSENQINETVHVNREAAMREAKKDGWVPLTFRLQQLIHTLTEWCRPWELGLP